MVYIGLILWIIFSSLICFGRYFNVERNKKLFIVLVFTAMGLIMAVRSLDVGIDTRSYKDIFDRISATRFNVIFSNYFTYSMEIGFALFMKICSQINGNYYFFQVVFSFIFSFLAAKFIFEEADNVFIGTIVFLGIGIYAITFNVARQMLAVMLVANAWLLLKKGKKKKSIILMLVATLFHITALIFIVAYIIYFFMYNKFAIRLVPAIAVVATLNFDTLFNFVTKYFRYYHNYYANEKTIQTAGGVWIVWIIVLIIAVRIVYLTKQFNFERSLIAIFSMVWVICNIIGLSFNYFERIGLYFIPFVPIMFSFSGTYIKNKLIRNLYLNCMTVAFIAYFLLSVLYSNQYVYTTFL